MSNSIFQSVIVQLKEIPDRTFGVIDTEGCVVSCTDMSMLGERWHDAALKVGNSSESIVTFGQKTFKAIVGNSNYFEYAVFCTGDDEAARGFCQVAYVALNDAKTFYEEKHDRGPFVKNIIMDNILPGDIYIRAKELHFATDAPRAVFLVRQLGHGDVATVDVLSSATPLAVMDQLHMSDFMTLFLGQHGGVLGETCAIAIILGGVYLLIRGIADWRIPVSFIGTVFVCYLIKDGAEMALYQVLAGGLLLGAFFMATDYATSPINKLGRVIFGIGCGFFLFIIRAFANYPEGCSFAILFMNVATPMIDRFTMPRPFGEVKKHG